MRRVLFEAVEEMSTSLQGSQSLLDDLLVLPILLILKLADEAM